LVNHRPPKLNRDQQREAITRRKLKRAPDVGDLDDRCGRGVKAPEIAPKHSLPGSTLPRDLRAIGYEVTEIGQTQRILPHAVTQKFETSSSGALVPVTEHSTRPVSVQVTNAGIATVEQFDLTTP
jgi:hypothetical protein